MSARHLWRDHTHPTLSGNPETGPAETDPTGAIAGEPGAKLDAGKNRLSLVIHGFARALLAVGEVATEGARKYCDDGWRAVPDGLRRYTDAQLRHHLAAAAGEATDPGTGLLHLAHEAWNCLARLELVLANQDRLAPLAATTPVVVAPRSRRDEAWELLAQGPQAPDLQFGTSSYREWVAAVLEYGRGERELPE